MREFGWAIAALLPATGALAQEAPPQTGAAATSIARPDAPPASLRTAPATTDAATTSAPVADAQAAAGGRAATGSARAAADEPSDEPDIVVTGQRNLPGAVVGDIPPEQQLGPADIRSYGVSSVADLLAELSPQTTSGRGQGGAPVVLLNGRRISGFQEIRDLPTEAIARVDILPEEVALKYGYAADQRVVNFVLRRRFRSTTVELADRVPTEGGRNAPDGNVDLLNIKGDGRVQLHVELSGQSALTEDERSITQVPTLFASPANVQALANGVIDPRLGTATVAAASAATASGTTGIGQFAGGGQNITDVGRYRTLLPSTTTLNANLVYARAFGKVGATVNGELAVSDSTSLNGLPIAQFSLPAGNPFSPFGSTVLVDRAVGDRGALTQNVSAVSGHLGATFNGNLGQWRWSLTANGDRAQTNTFTDAGLDTAAFQARITAGDPTANPFAGLNAVDVPGANGSVARSTTTSGGANALFNGTLIDLPAGSVSTAIRVGVSTSELSSSSRRLGVFSAADLTRTIEDGQVNVDIPLTSRGRDVLPWAGNLSVNANLAVRHLSDFGTLTTRGYGVNWSPRDGIRVLASATDQGDAPSQAQLGNPLVVTPNVRVFDYVLGTTATVTTVSGGNPALVADSRHTRKVEVNLKPWKAKDLTFVANYVTSRTDNAIAAFPTTTAAIAAAFPGRFTRDGTGTLTRLDSRPINFARQERSELRYGVNFSMPLKSKLQKALEAFRAGKGPNPMRGLPIPDFARRQFGRNGEGSRPGAGAAATPPGGDGAPPPPPGDGTQPNSGQGTTTGGNQPAGQGGASTDSGRPAGRFGGPGGGFGGAGGGGRGPGGGGFGGGRGGGQGGGRLQFAFYHTIHFTDSVLIAAGGPRLDLLNGDAIGQSGGQPRHEVEGQAGYLNNGLGVRFSLNYQTGTAVAGGTAAQPNPLAFSSLTTVALRVFADPSGRFDLIAKHPWLRGTRASLSVDNLFNSRQRVTDQTGAVPVSYQPDYLNPLGRTIRLSMRKLFF